MPDMPVGGGVDGPIYADLYNNADVTQLNAAGANLRQTVHLVKDTSVLFLSEMAGEIHVYDYPPTSPTLSPLVPLHQSTFAVAEPDDTAIDARYEQYVDALPVQLRVKIAQNDMLPEDQQDPKIAAFVGVLRGMAELSLWASNFNEVNEAQGPATVEQQVLSMVSTTKSGLVMLQNAERNIAAEAARLPDSDPNKLVLASYLKEIADIISACKSFLQEMQVTDALQNKANSNAQRESAEAKLKKTLESIRKAMEAKAKKHTMDLVMKIVGPVATALITIGTMGTGTLAAIALSVALAAISIADEVNGFMSKGLQSAMAALQKECGEVGGALLMIAMVLVMVVVAKQCAAKIGTGFAAKQAAKQLGKEATKEAIEQATTKSIKMSSTMVAFQAGMMGASSSGALASLCMSTAKAVFPKDEDAQAIFAMVMQLIIMLTAVLGAAKAGMGSVDTSKLAQVCDVVGDAVNGVSQVYQGVMQIKIGLINKEKGEILAAIEILESALTTLGVSKQEVQKGIKGLQEQAGDLGNLFTSILHGQQQQLGNITKSMG